MSLRIFSLEEDFFELRGLSLEEDFLERRGADGGGLSSFLGGGDRCGEVDLRGETDLCVRENLDIFEMNSEKRFQPHGGRQLLNPR
ncbi:unnamed protein product [Microthlaspi erraticum]|uniref:Uncharacterized protein n=1 Tax=Microthlaspi erraticum TaxID=1685480 RepID=A0A6D2KQW4_9BRAS|nr:unnamed protein product [Microthlaspi erraticum]